jgi:hypothetical protein
VVQAAFPADGTGRWQTYGAFDRQDEAATLERRLATSHFPGGSGASPVTRTISLLKLLVEGPEAVHNALCWLATSDHEWNLRLGGDESRTPAIVAALHEHGFELFG